MIYSCQYTTRWHDADAQGKLRPGAILTYFEETSGMQMREAGKSLDILHEKQGLAFILSRIRLKFEAPVLPYRDIRVDTYTTKGSAYTSPRYFVMSEGEKRVASAESLWALVDVYSHMPVKIDAFSFGEHFHEPTPEELPSIRIHCPKQASWEKLGERTVRYSDIDYNGHMNNTRYPDMLMDFLTSSEQSRIREMTLSFLREATYGETYDVWAFRDAESQFIFLRTLDSKGHIHLEAEIKQ